MAKWLDRWQSSDSLVLGGLALIVGLSSGAGVWLFQQVYKGLFSFSFTTLGNAIPKNVNWLIFLIPVVGGLVVGLGVHFFIGEERHHGVAGVMEAVALAGGRLRYQRTPLKALASALSLGTGASIGPEDPSVQIGASLGSMFGQKLHLSDDRIRSLTAAGAASGIAAAFNAPIAGVFFALEVVLGEISGGAFGVVVVAAVISSAFIQATTGTQPAFRVPAYAFHSIWELPLYLILGLIAGPIAALYVRGLYQAQDLFHHLIDLPKWAKTILAGLAVGLAGIFLPQLFGVGYGTIEKVLASSNFGFWLLAALMIGKLVITPICIAGGFPGGVFAPALFIGAMLGGAFGVAAQHLLPGLQLTPPAFAMVGMAAVLAGSVHAPLTAVLLLFEMTNDYRIILPLMFAVVVSLVIAQSLERDSVYTLGLARKGIRLERGRDIEVLETIKVSEVMETGSDTLRDVNTLAEASQIFNSSRHHGMPVLNEQGKLVGVFTLQDLDATQVGTWSQRTVGEACTRDLLVTYPDETIGSALRLMGGRDLGRLPVVARDDPSQLVGILRRSDLVRAYELALTKRATMRHRAQQVRLGAVNLGSISVQEIEVEKGAVCTGKRIVDINWPPESIVASLRRGRIVRIPHGETVLKPGDVLMVVAEGDAMEGIQKICQTQMQEQA
jgi:CIC family chloride channel protein